MADIVVLRLRDDDDACEWVVVDANGRLTEPRRYGRLADVRDAASGRSLIVLVPGRAVVTTRVEMPQVSKARLRQMLPFALEEHFAEDVSSLHFAAGPRNDDDELLVSVVGAEQLETWLERLSAAALEPAAIYADNDGVADTPSTLNVIYENGTIYARRPGDAAFSIEGLDFTDAFSIVVGGAEDDDRPQHVLLCIDAPSHEANQEQINAAAAEFSSLDVKLLPDDALPMFAAKLVNHPGSNLLQGLYAPKSNWGAVFKPWRFAAMLAAGVVAVALLSVIVDYVQLRRQDSALTTALSARCNAAFSTADLRQCEGEVQSRLRSVGETTGGGEEFLSTLANVAQTAGTANTLRTLSYRNSVMDLQVLSPGVPALDAFSRELDESGPFSVAVQSTNPQEDGTVESRLQIVGENR
jgi:general secretion pathway protein L